MKKHALLLLAAAMLLSSCRESHEIPEIVQKTEETEMTTEEHTESLTAETASELTPLEALLTADTKGSSKKKSYSDYISDFTETPLLSFDTTDVKSLRIADGAYIDTEYMREGKGALRWDLEHDITELAEGKMMQVSRGAFDYCVTDRHRSTLKFWLFVNDTDLIDCDHDAGYGRQVNQATFFFRATDRNGKTHCWNHTITDDGWHEIELTFNVHNGADADFDYGHITGFWMMFTGKKGATVIMDDLRGVEYRTDYVPAEMSEGCRLITDAAYDALDGAVVQEWYGTYYDTDDFVTGKSSLCCVGDSSVNDFRIIVANTDIPLSYQGDELVFTMKLDDLDAIDGLFLELNHVQDQHEYERSFSVEELKKYGLGGENEWSEIVIPLSDFKKNLKPAVYGEDEDIVMHNFRFVISPKSGKSYKVHLDRAYVRTK